MDYGCVLQCWLSFVLSFSGFSLSNTNTNANYDNTNTNVSVRNCLRSYGSTNHASWQKKTYSFKGAGSESESDLMKQRQ